MSDEFDFTKVGGRLDAMPNDTGAMAGPNIWNFGVVPAGPGIRAMIQAKPSLWVQYPHFRGAWDGQSTVNHCDAVRRTIGEDALTSLVQYQPRGTCGGRAGSATCDFVQCIMLALGKPIVFKRVSHASVYYAARKLYNMLEGSWQDENQDGVASGAVPEALSKIGVNSREEIGDLNYYGEGSDDLACKLGAGQMQDLARKLEELAKDNIIKEWAPVKSAQELADGIASGGIGIGSDNQGFTMTRDRQGFCRPTGSWAHYQVRISVFGQPRKGFGYWQSWGQKTPGGPLLPGHIGNCFGVDFDVQDRIIRSGDWAVVWGMPPFELAQPKKIDIPWTF